MELEDPRINEPPGRWMNIEKNVFLQAVWFNIGIWIVSVIIFVAEIYFMPTYKHVFLLIPIMFIVMGIVALLYGYFANTDFVSKWHMDLPYNHLLFELLVENVPRIIEDNEMEYDLFSVFSMPNIEVDPDTEEKLARCYKIKSNYGEELQLEFGLRMIEVDKNSYFYSYMYLANVEINNLNDALKIANAVEDYLFEIEIDKFQDVEEEPDN